MSEAGRPMLLARRIGKRRHGARMAERERHPHVDHVGDRQIGFLASVLVEHRVGNGLQRQDRLAVDGPVESLRAAVRHERGKDRPAPVRSRRRRAWRSSSVMVSNPWASVSAMASCANVTSRTGNFTASPDRPRGNPLSVPALVELAEIFADLLRKGRSARRSAARPRSGRPGWERSPAWPRQGRARPPWPVPQAARPRRCA